MWKRISRKSYYMKLALIAAERSSCSRANVWAIIIKDWIIVTTWYNGAAKWEVDCLTQGCLLQNWHCIRTIHAEENAIINCAKNWISTKWTEIFVTHRPCDLCARKIINAWIKKVYFYYDYKIYNEKID